MVPVLYVSENSAIVHRVTSVLRGEGFTVLASSPSDAFAVIVTQQQPTVILLDAQLVFADIREVLERLLTHFNLTLDLTFAVLKATDSALESELEDMLNYLDFVLIEFRGGQGPFSREITKLALHLH